MIHRETTWNPEYNFLGRAPTVHHSLGILPAHIQLHAQFLPAQTDRVSMAEVYTKW